MDRKQFLKLLAVLPLAATAMKLPDLHSATDPLNNTEAMPVLFVGHGSPMNAIEENEFVTEWRRLGKTLPSPNAILCISAHWETRGTWVTAMEKPKTIHDFGGFPQALFDVQYPAPGSPSLANETKQMVKKTAVGLDDKWGLDHGTWSIIHRMYPKADIPVLQLSLDYNQTPQYHYELAKELAGLRRKGVLILGSGNLVHNLRLVAWDKMQAGEYAYDWAMEANNKMKQLILRDEHQQLINYPSLGKDLQLAVPTPEHFLPLLYTLALKEEKDKISFFNDKTVLGSLSMTSVRIG